MAASRRTRALALTHRLATHLAAAPRPAGVAYAYHPLLYAQAGFRAYLERFGDGDKRVLLVGMNPGPFGMAQTGIPFGAVGAVRDWLGIEVAVGRPAATHPRRPVEGFACRREEVSGRRLWGWLEGLFGRPERLFAGTMVLNFCPVLFLDAGGRNLTPDRLPAADRRFQEEACRATLRALAELWAAELVVGVGAFAAAQARQALAGGRARVGQVLHPSPASPLANRGFAAAATRSMRELAPKWAPPPRPVSV